MHRIRNFAALLVAGLFLISCGGGEDRIELPEPTPLEEISEGIYFHPKWQSTAPGVLENNLSSLQPLFLGASVIIASVDGNIVALDSASSGRVDWRVETEEKITAGLGGDQQRIIAVTESGNVVARSASDGAELWRYAVGRVILATPLVYRNGVYLRTIDGMVIGLNAATGEELWVSEFNQPNFTIRGLEELTAWNDSVIVGTAGGLVIGFDVNYGITNWQIELRQGAGGALDTESVNVFPLVAGDVLYTATVPDSLRSYNLQGRRQLWSQSKEIKNRLTTDVSQVYGVSDNDEVFAVDRLDGKELWRLESLRYRGVADFVTMNGYLVVADREGVLHAAEVVTGRILGRAELKGDVVTGGLEVRQGTLYVSMKSGTIQVFTLEADPLK